MYGRLTRADGHTPTDTTQLGNNAICDLFKEIRYELNATEIDRSKNVDLPTLMKNYICQSPSQISLLKNSGWIGTNDGNRVTDENGFFDIPKPLGRILGFAEDHCRIFVNAKHELILTRLNTDTNTAVQTPLAAGAAAEQFEVSLLKIEWTIPKIKIADQRKIQLLQLIAKEMYEYPLPPATSKHGWTVKTSTQLEKSRYIIVGF